EARRVATADRQGNSDRPRERVKCGLGVNLGVLSTEELVASETFVHFKELVDQALDAVEDVDIKMKAVGAMKEMPVHRLVRLLSLLLANIKDGPSFVPFAKPAEDAEDTEGRLWRELCMERVMRSVESSLTALIIMTSPGMPKQVFVEDVIERAVAVAKFQLNSTHKATQQSIRSQRAKERGHGALAAGSGGGRPRALTHLLNRLVELVDSFAQLVDLQRLTDNAILAMSGLAWLRSLLRTALRLCTSVFCQYEKHRQLILEDLFASLARLPSSKRSLRSFRLNSEESIQMLTALSLLLVQSVVLLPASVPSSKDQDNTAAMALLDAYESAKKTAQVFLVVFLNKCAKKAEEQDYRGIFEKLQDLLLAVNKPEWPAAEMFLSLLGGLLVKQFADRSVDQALRVASLDYLGTVASRLRKDARDERAGSGQSGGGDPRSATAAPTKPPITKEERIVILQKAIVDYLNAEDVDASVHYAVRFYLAQWYKDCAKESAAGLQERLMSTGRSDAYMLDYEEACLVCRYLASMRPFSQSFDIYLSQILKASMSSQLRVRTKAIKCLTAVVELTAQYYGMLSERILDTGISVRKRMCVKMIRRVNDEEGIRKLVNEVFQAMWFSPVKESHNVKLLQKVMNITDVVAACKDQRRRKKTRAVDTLVANIMRLEEISSNNNQRLVACLCTLYMLTKIRPNLMVDHASTLQSYLKIKISSQQDNYVLHYVAKILELTVPLMEHPDEEELRSIEQRCAIACLSAVVNRVTHNYSLIRSCFNLFYTPIDRQQQRTWPLAPSSSIPGRSRQSCAACTPSDCLLKYFDLESITTYETGAYHEQRVFSSFMFFCSQCADPDVVKKSLMGLGFMCARHSHLLLQDPLKTYYCELIAGGSQHGAVRLHLEEHVQQESLKEMHDVQSGKASMVAQAYLDHVSPRCWPPFYYKDAGVRLAALTMVVDHPAAGPDPPA
uniref:Nipped-B protein n=1 Tax=Macrostomum lignano TaxID=282301 RepID=A0A1I8F9I1_9PLAT